MGKDEVNIATLYMSMNTRYFSEKTLLIFCSLVSIRRKLLSSLAFRSIFVTQISTRAGFFDGISEEEYQSETLNLISLAKEVSALDKSADGKTEKVTTLKSAINSWVSKYRREPKFAGRPSYSNMYTAANALSGHFNNFGPTTAIPKKRLDRVVQELDQSNLFLSKGR